MALRLERISVRPDSRRVADRPTGRHAGFAALSRLPRHLKGQAESAAMPSKRRPPLAPLRKSRLVLFALALQAATLIVVPAYAQVKIDVSAETARRAANKTYLDDLAVHDTALIYQSICIENESLFVPGWTIPADLAASDYKATGLMLRIEVLPGKKLKATLIDAAQGQGIAKGHSNEPKTLSASDYNVEVINYVNGLFAGGAFGVDTCEEERRANPLRTLNLFSIESINGFTKISELLASVTSKGH